MLTDLPLDCDFVFSKYSALYKMFKKSCRTAQNTLKFSNTKNIMETFIKFIKIVCFTEINQLFSFKVVFDVLFINMSSYLTAKETGPLYTSKFIT